MVFVVFVLLLLKASASVLDKGQSFLLSASCAASVEKGRKLLADGSSHNALHILREVLILCPSQGEAQMLLIDAFDM